MTEPTRKRDLRVKATFRVRYRTMDELVIAYSNNLSRGGVFVATEQLLDPGSVVQLNVELPDEGPEITIPCEVVYRRDKDAAGDHSPGMGVKFIDPDRTACQRLEWFIINSVPEPGQIGTGPRARTLKILIVDDDPLQSKAAAAPFEARGDEVRICRDGLDALGCALKDIPDAILSDVQMPKMDGWQLLRMLRARAALAKVPILFLTTLADEQDRLKGYRLGVDDYIAKPFQASDLVARTDRAVVRAEQQALASAPADVNAMHGDLEQVSLPSVLSFLEIERRSGILRVGPVTNAFIYLREGQPVRVVVQGAKKTAAPKSLLFELFELRVGRFDFRPGVINVPDELGVRTTALLLEHAKLSDEKPVERR